MQISKFEAAVRQLDVAIRLFLEGDYISSLTLAGAAEDILGALSQRAGKPVAVEQIATYHRKDTDQAISDEASKKVIFSVLNRGRNQAKHANDPNETHCDDDMIWPLQMIMRAIPMALNLGVSTANMGKMKIWVDAHIEEMK